MQKFKQIIFAVLLGVFVLGLTGCETFKGIGSGFKKDVKGLSFNIKKADDWFKKNLW